MSSESSDEHDATDKELDNEIEEVLRGKPVDARTKAFIWVTFSMYVLYIWSLPALSWFFNQYLGYAEELCWIPAGQVECGNGADYLELAKAAGRERNGTYYGCGCGQGVFGDTLCAVKSTAEIQEGLNIGYTLSQLISTAPATGGMALVSIGPILSMWSYGIVDPEIRRTVKKALQSRTAHSTTDQVIWWSLVAFQTTYGFFLFNTYCIFSVLHRIFTAAFMLSYFVFGTTVAYTIGSETIAAKIVRVLTIAGIVSFVVGYVVEDYFTDWIYNGIQIGQYSFWFGEALGLTFAFAGAPVLATLQGTQFVHETLNY